MKILAALAVAAFAGAVATSAIAADYNATTAFNGTGESGAFQYGTSTGDFTHTGVFTQFSATSYGCAGDANFLCANDGALVPGIGKVTDGGQSAFETVLVPSGTLWVHPGTNVESEIIFTVPVTGAYSFSAQIGRLDTTSNGNGVDAFFEDFTGTHIAPDIRYGDDYVTLGLNRNFTAGQQVAFAVNNDGDYTYDSTAVDLSVDGPDAISAAPEPSTWALMLGGIGILGGLLRVSCARRREDQASGMAEA